MADITYIRLETEFVSQAVLLDVFSRRVLGWVLGYKLEDELTLAVFAHSLGASPAGPSASLCQRGEV